MSNDRKNNLKLNFRLMFWIQALSEIKVMNVISAIFMVHRGLDLSQIFLIAVIFAIVSVLTEVPSSYIADKWSRKGLILSSLIFGLVSWIVQIFAFGFWPFVTAVILYSISYSLSSGTDEAIIYDSSRELGEGEQSLKQLGRYFSSQRIFKIVTPVVAVLIAMKLSESQFVTILMIDVVANIIALFLSMYITEPKRIYNDEKVKKGIVKDAFLLIKNDTDIVKMMMNHTTMFTASFVVWRISSEYFRSIGTPILLLGISTSVYQLITMVFNLNSHKWFRKFDDESVVNVMNLFCALSLMMFFVNELYWKNIIVALTSFMVLCVAEVSRWPYFSNITNKFSQSFNRATTISLTNLLRSVVQVPLLILSSFLITDGYIRIFGLTLVMGIMVCLVFSLSGSRENDKMS